MSSTTLYRVQHYRAPEIEKGQYTAEEVREIFKRQKKKNKFDNDRYFKSWNGAYKFLLARAEEKCEGSRNHHRNMLLFREKVKDLKEK